MFWIAIQMKISGMKIQLIAHNVHHCVVDIFSITSDVGILLRLHQLAPGRVFFAFGHLLDGLFMAAGFDLGELASDRRIQMDVVFRHFRVS